MLDEVVMPDFLEHGMVIAHTTTVIRGMIVDDLII
jgi:hypothetical protein